MAPSPHASPPGKIRTPDYEQNHAPPGSLLHERSLNGNRAVSATLGGLVHGSLHRINLMRPIRSTAENQEE